MRIRSLWRQRCTVGKDWMVTATKNSSLIPGQVLIYERANGVLYAKYRDPPHNTIPRWIIGGDPIAVARARGEVLSHSEFNEIQQLAQEYPVLKEQLEQLRTTYYMIKN